MYYLLTFIIFVVFIVFIVLVVAFVVFIVLVVVAFSSQGRRSGLGTSRKAIVAPYPHYQNRDSA